jgi:hypothetical protein
MGAGLGYADALRYLFPDLDRAGLRVAYTRYFRSIEYLSALERVNGGAWETLEPKRRLEIALDRHVAEMAYFLITTPFHTLVTGPGGNFEMAREARKVIEAKLGSEGGSNDPLVRFAKAAIASAAREAKGELLPHGMVDTFESPGVKWKPS